MNCLLCNIIFIRTGRNHRYCLQCAKLKQKENVSNWQKKYRTLNPGVGSGGTTGFEKDNPYYRHGQCVFRRWAKERLKQLSFCCERCGSYIDVAHRGSWAGHHKDHNRSNNVKENLEVLCKKCHQIEHECWKAFQSVTTIPKGSTQEIAEAPGSTTVDDDIVCSA